MKAQLLAATSGLPRGASVRAIELPFHIEFPLGRMVLFGSLSLVDLFLTWVLIGHSSGIVYESNPIANLLLTHYGWAGMVLFKVTDVLLVAWIVLLVGMFQPHAARRVLSVACGIVGAVALYSSFLVIQFA